jgi:hypothetical protein
LGLRVRLAPHAPIYASVLEVGIQRWLRTIGG